VSSRVIFPLASVRGAVAVHEPGSVWFGKYSVWGGKSLDRIPIRDVLGQTVEGGCWRNVFLHPVSKHGPRSLTYVRVQEWQTPVRNESNSGRTFGHYPPATIPREKGLSVSIHVGTRKMVNYA